MPTLIRTIASGSTSVFSIPFPYLDKSHAKVYRDGVLQPPSAYTWPTAGTIQFTAGNPPAGTVVTRMRMTPADKLVNFVPGNLASIDLNLGVLQPLFRAEEAYDLASDINFRDWKTEDFAAGGTITKGTLNEFALFDASGNVVPSTTTLTAVLASIAQEVQDRINAVNLERTQRIEADNLEALIRATADTNEQTARIAADNAEATIRGNADVAEAMARVAGDAYEAEQRIAGLAAEATHRINADNAEAATRLAADNLEISLRTGADAAEQTARIDGDIALSSLIGQAGPIEVPFYDTMIAAGFAVVKVGINVLRTGGRNAPGDNMGAEYKYVASGALNNARFETANNRIFQVVRPEGKSAWNVKWFGMSTTNTGAQNDAAWAGLLAVALPDDEVEFPQGNYTFATTSNFFPYKLVTDGEVELSGPQITNIQYTVVKRGSIKLRQTGTFAWARPFERFPDPEKGVIKNDYISVDEVDDSELYPEYMLQQLKPFTMPLAGDTWTPVATVGAGFTFTTDLCAVDLGAMPDQSWVALLDERPEVGSFYSMGHDKGPVPGAMQALFVRTKKSWRVWYQNSSVPGLITSAQKYAGFPIVLRDVPPITETGEDVPAYQMRNSSLGIYLTKHNEYVVSLNGVTIEGPVRSFSDETVDAIGWGWFHPTGETGVAGLIRPYKARNPQPPAPRPMRIVVFGDSITDPLVAGWPDNMTSHLQGSLGCQVEEVLNVGLSGNTSAQQLTALQALDLTGYNMAVGMVGVNDQQLSVAHGTYVSNLNDIIGLFDSENIPVVLASPTPYYSTPQANAHGGNGVATLVAEGGSKYRDSVMQTVAIAQRAGKRCAAVDTGKALPPVLPQYLDWSKPGNRADPVVIDNVHPSSRVRAYLGRAMAKAVLGLVCPKPRRGIPPHRFEEEWFMNTWEDLAPTWHSSYSIDAQGIKHLRVFIRTQSVTPADWADGIQVMQLPLYLAPSDALNDPLGGTKFIPAYTDDLTPAHAILTTAGVLTVFGISDTSKWIAFDTSYR